MNMKRFIKIAYLFVVTLTFSTAYAWDGAVSGAILQYDVVTSVGGAPHNFAFRVYLTGRPALCTGNVNGNNTWAYVNSDEANYSALVAAIISAKALGSQVRIYSNIDSSGYCHIGYVMVT